MHVQHWRGLHLRRGAEADLWVPVDGQLRQRWRKQGRPGMNTAGLPKTCLDGGALSTPSAPLGAKRTEWMNLVAYRRCGSSGPLCPEDRATRCLLFQVQGRSECSFACYTYCQEFYLSTVFTFAVHFISFPPKFSSYII